MVAGPAVFVALLLVGFLLVAAGIAWALYREKKRTEEIAHVATQLDLPFFESGDPLLVRELSIFHLFSQGRSKKIRNMIHGETEDIDLGIFDYQFTTGSGKNNHTWRQTVAYFKSSDLNLPGFALRPEKFFDRLGKVFGFQDINFDSHPAFSSSFLLNGADEGQIRQLFDADLLTFLEGKPGISLEGCGTQLIFYRASKRVAPHEIRQFMADGFDMFQRLRK